MRTPNCNCIICSKPLYRRPNELTKYSFVCCKECRSEAYVKYPNKNTLNNLNMGREKGTNHLNGIPKSKESNIKRSLSHKLWCKTYPDKVHARGLKTRGTLHYHWKGGCTKLNKKIRLLNENRKWMREVKARDGKCTICDSIIKLEAHHIIDLAVLIKQYNIQNIDEARMCFALWDLKNGLTLCEKCHYQSHGRTYGNK